MKTYENFIIDLFRKLPKEILQLKTILTNFINKNTHESNCYALSTIVNNIISIKIKKEVLIGIIEFDFIRLYYNYSQKKFICHIIQPLHAFESDDKNINNIREFIENNMLHILNDGPITQLISIDKIQSIINEITQDNYELFIKIKKYNL